MSERKPDRVIVLTDQELLEAVLSGVRNRVRGPLDPSTTVPLERAQLEKADNGAVLRVWLRPPEGTR